MVRDFQKERDTLIRKGLKAKSVSVTTKQINDHIKLIYRDLQRIEKSVHFMQLHKGTLVVRTKPIILEGNNIGSFWIRFKLNTGSVTVINERLSDGGDGEPWFYQHPHITSRGKYVCFGNAKRTYLHFKKDFMFGSMTSVIIILLGSYNEENAFCGMDSYLNDVTGGEREEED